VLGAQMNTLVAQGEYWRLLAAMFLHIGLAHLAFNGWALYSLGRDVEAFYGSRRFAAIYFLAGLFGNVAFYLFGDRVLSAGASGAIFGLVGAEIAFFLRNRQLFGSLGRQRLMNLAILVGINLVYGFVGAGINNLAHLGGLFAGLLLGLALTPRYEVAWRWAGSNPEPRLVNTTPVWVQAGSVGIAVILLVTGISLGDQLWAGRATPRQLGEGFQPRQQKVTLVEEVPHVSYRITSFNSSSFSDRGGLVSGERVGAPPDC
jgi:rhomboid protease GluP